MTSDADGTLEKGLQVIQLWRLPDDFFKLDPKAQWKAIEQVTTKAVKSTERRKPCDISMTDDAMAAGYFLISLGLPWVGPLVSILLFGIGSKYFKWAVAAMLVLTFHPMPRNSLFVRSSRLSLAIIRYFTYEILIDRNNPLVSNFGTSKVDEEACIKASFPSLYLACPHGVFNYGAMVWCSIGRWMCGWYQYTGANAVVGYVPGLRYMDPFGWLVDPKRETIKRIFQERAAWDAKDAARRGGVLGMVPDGIAGAFNCKPGIDELLIGKKRGLMRICLEEGVTVYATWFFGTTDMLSIVADPFGILEKISRKMQAGIMYYYGRWYLPVPRRIPLTQVLNAVKTEKNASPSEEQVDKLHTEVYGGLAKVYEAQKAYAGYSDRVFVLK